MFGVSIIDKSSWRVLSMSGRYSAALPIAYVVLRLLIIFNWFIGAAILALLLVMPNREWIMSALDLSPGAEAERIIWGLRGIAVVGLVTIPINYGILKRLLAMIDTVRAGDPFVAANAYRLNAIAWFLLALQLLGLVIAAIAWSISTKAHPVEIDGTLSINGWLAILLTFILARVFAEGTLMREDLEGTV
jgi:hypothetical protein